MKPTSIIQRLVILLITLMSALGANAQQAYACYTPSDKTLTFYYDNLRSSREGTTYDMNAGSYTPGWYDNSYNVTKVVFDPSFADFRPTTTNRWFYRMSKLLSIEGLNNLNTSRVTDMSSMFSDCSSLTRIDISHFDTSNVTDMRYMFSFCSSLTSLDVSNFNTAEVTTMTYMFSDCSNLTSLALVNFNTAKVTDMYAMFDNCYQLQSLDLSSFNTANVTEMEYMFTRCGNLQTIYVGSGWSTAAVTKANDMFFRCTSLVGGQGTTYNESNVDKSYARIDRGISGPGYFTDAATRQAYACYTPDNTTLTFYYDTQRSSRSGTTYNLNTGTVDAGWDTDGTKSDVTMVVFDSSFADARPTTTYDWFYGMSNLQSITGISYLNTSEVTSMSWMFGNCAKLTTLDLSHFNTSKVNKMSRMFNGCSNLQTIYVGSGWSTANVTNSDNMFYNCTSLKGAQGTTYDASIINATYAHIDGGPSNPGYFTAPREAYACYTPSNTTLTFYYDDMRSSRSGTTYYLNIGSCEPAWIIEDIDVTKVVFDPSFADTRPTTTYDWFGDMMDLHSITGISYLNTSEVTNMQYMFASCWQLWSLDLSHLNTSKVTNMECMFMGCQFLSALDLSHFNTSKVTNMALMFRDCQSLSSLDLGSFNTANVTEMACMFMGCRELKTIYVSDDWSTDAVTSSDDMFDACDELKGGQGTMYDSYYKDKTYARIDGGTNNPGYFTYKKPSGITTGVAPQVTSDKSQVTSDEWYTIDGRKLNGMPAKKGVYIQNGKKTIVH